MKEKHWRKALVLILLAVTALFMGAKSDLEQDAKDMWIWFRPEVYPQPLPGDMDVDTLSTLLDSGNLQWYMPRPEQDQWDSIVAMKIHAPPEVVWKVLVDYERYSEYMPDVLKESKILSRDGNEVRTWHRATNNVISFEVKYEIFDIITEDPPYHLHSETPEGGLKGRQIDWYLVPIDNDQNTLIIIRHYPHMKSLGISIRAVLAVMPWVEWTTSASAANYILRGQKEKSERLAGYTPPPKPAPLRYEAIKDVETLRTLDRYSCGLIRETPEGKTINGLNYTFINARPELVWEVITDFDHFQDFRVGEFEVRKREGDQVWVYQAAPTFSILIFSFGGMELLERYTLEPPHHLSFQTVEGLYEGSAGDYHILPIEGGKKSVLFHTIGLNTEKDTSLTMRIVKSGAFPAETLMFITIARGNLADLKEEAEKRAGTGK